MRKILKATLLLCFIASSTILCAQELSDFSARKLKRMGYNYLSIGDTYSAIDCFKAYCDKKQKPKITYELAECYRATRNYIPAATYYDKTYRLDKNNLVALYHYGEMLKVYGYYADAKKYFVTFKQLYKGGEEIDYKRLVTQQIIACDSAQGIIDSALSVEMKRLNSSINKPSVEMSPVLMNDSTLLYAQMRVDAPIVFIPDAEKTELPYRHFYTAEKKGKDWHFKQEWMEGEFNQDYVHSCNGAFSPDKKKFYFTRCEQDWQYKTNCKIYVSKLNKDKWSERELLTAQINKKM
ncbi:MAG: hypothetical protein MJ198_09350, partial [Bacteroidales bacterium]|nr:hypothetical protein [Bacteroidales bacterium]